MSGAAHPAASCSHCGGPLPEPLPELHGSPTGRWPEFPFCSRRCRLLDLHRWLAGGYVIPGPEVSLSETPSDPVQPDPTPGSDPGLTGRGPAPPRA